jgi:hypothetical protein
VRRGWHVLAAAALWVAPRAHADCPPPEALLQGVRSAGRIQVEELGSDATRLETPLAHVPGRTLGYEVQGVFRVSVAVADALQRAFGRRDSYACGPEAPLATFQTPGWLQIGFLFGSGGGAVAAVLHLPEGEVELQREGDARTSAPLSRVGQRRWEEALRLLERETGASPEEFYRQMLPPAAAAPGPRDSARAPEQSEPPDSARAPRDEAHAPR